MEKIIFISAGALWAFVSLSLVGRIWVIHRREGFLKKLFWSGVVMVPLLGWIFYGAGFTSLSSNDSSPGEYPGI